MLRIEPPPLSAILDAKARTHRECPEVVGVHLEAYVVEVAIEQSRSRTRAGVVDQQGDVPGDPRRGGHRVGVGHVELDHLGAGQVDSVGMACPGVDGGPLGQQLGGQVTAEPSVGSGHEGG
jgi:hypothetical protein